MATDIVLMNKGVIMQHDKPSIIYNQPKNIFTVQFIGTPEMNIIPQEDFKGQIEVTEGVASVSYTHLDVYKRQAYDVLVTDEQGYDVSIELPYGTYTVRETKTPDEVNTVADFEVVINQDSREPLP